MKYLGVLLLVLSGNVMAEEVYYCSDNYSNGFMKKDGQFKPFNFIEGGKFKMKLQDDGNITIENPKLKSGIDLYYCLTSYKGIIPDLKTINHVWMIKVTVGSSTSIEMTADIF